jgi:hypothetical protein
MFIILSVLNNHNDIIILQQCLSFNSIRDLAYQYLVSSISFLWFLVKEQNFLCILMKHLQKRLSVAFIRGNFVFWYLPALTGKFLYFLCISYTCSWAFSPYIQTNKLINYMGKNIRCIVGSKVYICNLYLWLVLTSLSWNIYFITFKWF